MLKSRPASPAAWLGDRLLVPLLIAAALIGLWMAAVVPVDGDDACFHLRWIPAFYELLKQGIVFPRWLPHGFHGFGAPTFYFYPPLTYYISSVVMLLSGEALPEVVFRITAALTTVASVFTSYLLLRRLDAPKKWAVLGALFYGFAPYRQFDLYTRSSLSQPMGFVFVPLVFSGILDLVRRHAAGWRRWVPGVMLTVSWAALMLCAFPIALVTAITSLIFAIAYNRHLNWSSVRSIFSSLALGSGLAAYHYLPSFYFQQYVQTDWYLGFSDGNWVPALLHGTQLRFVVQDLLVYGSEVVLLISIWRQRRELSPAVRNIGFVIAFFVLISTPYLSAPLWQYVPLFHFIQFHARFSIICVLLMSVLAFSSAAKPLERVAKRIAIVWGIVAVALSISVIFGIQMHPHGTSEWMDPPTFLPKTLPRASDATMDTIFLPHRHDALLEAQPSLLQDESLHLVERTATHSFWNLNALTPHRLVIHQFDWPQWKVFVDDNAVSVRPDQIGRVVLSTPTGNHTIRMDLQTSPAEVAGFVVSGISILLMFLSVVIGRPSINRKAAL
jgi:uncharacterized membrane protein